MNKVESPGFPNARVMTIIVAVALVGFGVPSQATLGTPPDASFASSATSVMTFQPVTFTDTSVPANASEATIDSWTWSFGDGATASTQHATHAWADEGDYRVCLTITETDLDADIACQTITVLNQAPVAGFTFMPASPSTADYVRFTDASTDDGTILLHSWDFGDDETSDEQSPGHFFADDGDYNVCLTVTDDDLAESTTCQVVSVSNVAPVTGWTVDARTKNTNVAFEFGDYSQDSDGDVVTRNWNFGDGTTSTAEHPSHAYTDDGFYNVCLSIADDDGAPGDVQCRTLTVLNVDPTASVTVDATTKNTLSAFQFTGSGSDTDGTIATYAWDFGDGATSTLANPSHAYTDDGEYDACLTVTDDDGADSVPACTMVTVTNQGPTAGFSYSPPAPGSADAVAFTDSSSDADGSIASWSWDFGDGSTSAAQSPSHAFADDTSYTVCLTVTDDDGATDATCQTVSVANKPPTADFTVDATTKDTNVAFQFTDASTDVDDVIASYAWTFGDGATSSTPSPSHAYSNDGVYSVSLTVTDDDGATDTKTISVTVSNVAPSASFSVDAGMKDTNVPFVFTDASTDSDGVVAAWAWDFGDGTTSTVASPTHAFTDDGNYNVCLTVTDNDGDAGAPACQTLIVNNVAPTGVMTVTATDESAAVVFDATASTDSDGTIVSYDWNFGDGATGTGVTPSHTYADGGVYSACLRVTDDDGAVHISCSQFSVAHVAPSAAFTWAHTNLHSAGLTTDDTVSFTDGSTTPKAGDSIASWSWAFDDGSTSTAQNPMHQYGFGDSYNVCLTVTDDDGQSAQSCQTLSPLGVPAVDFRWSPTAPHDLQTTQFTDLSTDQYGALASWSWDFGEGAPANTSALQHPGNDYVDDGTYTVCLAATNTVGVTNSTCHQVTVRNVAPFVSIDGGFSPANVGQEMTFTDAGSADLDGSIPDQANPDSLSYTWYFRGLPVGTGKSITFDFAGVPAGIHCIVLGVVDEDGDEGYGSKCVDLVTNLPTTLRVPVNHLPPFDFDEKVRVATEIDFADGEPAHNASVEYIISWQPRSISPAAFKWLNCHTYRYNDGQLSNAEGYHITDIPTDFVSRCNKRLADAGYPDYQVTLNDYEITAKVTRKGSFGEDDATFNKSGVANVISDTL